jgi:hypothetical protein
MSKVMAPDTQSEVIKINVKVLSSIAALIMLAVAGIAWGVRLEYRLETSRDDQTRLSLHMEAMRADRLRDNDRITRIESQLTYIVAGLEEIKKMLRDQQQARRIAEDH